MNLDMVDRNSAPEEFTCIWQSKWVGIITINTEKIWIPVVSWSLYFWKSDSLYSFRTDSILKSDGDFISNWTFPDCVHFFGAWARQAVIETIAVVYEHTKTHELMRCVRRLGTIIQSIFLCRIRSRICWNFWKLSGESRYPRALRSALTWKISSHLFSRLDWLPLDLRGWEDRCSDNRANWAVVCCSQGFLPSVIMAASGSSALWKMFPSSVW